MVNWKDEGILGLEMGETEKWELSDDEEYGYFLAGQYDTTYMYLYRRTPEEGMEALYREELAADYPGAVLSEYDGMPCMDMTGEERIWLIYDGITADYENYGYRIISLEERGLTPAGRFEVLGNYRTPIVGES